MNAMTPDDTIEPDRTAMVELARQRARRARDSFGASREEVACWALGLAITDVDGTGRPATDAELAAIVRAFLSDQS